MRPGSTPSYRNGGNGTSMMRVPVALTSRSSSVATILPRRSAYVNNPHCDGSPRVTGPRWLANYIVNEARYVSEETDSDVAERFRTCVATQTEASPSVQPGDKRSRSGE